jgi:amidase
METADRRGAAAALLLLGLALAPPLPAAAHAVRGAAYAVREQSVAALRAGLARGSVTSEALTRAYLARIEALDRAGPALHSVIAVNPHALDEARAADRARAAGHVAGPLAGIPVLIKDNIDAADGTATTAGSIALAANLPRRDAPLVARLRHAGAVILGKTNLSEWANFRSLNSISGWSAVGGLVKNPYALDRTACGSSAGTGAAIAASLAAVGVGTETDGSVTCPSSINGLAGFKPTVGLVSRSGVVPISHTQDTPGPMGRSVADIAALLDAMAGSDPTDPATKDADRHKRGYAAAVAGASLRGKRLGVLGFARSNASAGVKTAFSRALTVLRAQGAQIVEIADFKPNPALGGAEYRVLLTEFKSDLNAYLARTPPSVTPRTLAALIAFNRRDPRELGLFGQETFVRAEATTGTNDIAYRRALATCKRYAGAEGIDALVMRYRLDALIAPTAEPASRIDVIDGDNIGGGAGQLPAVAGYPHLTVPMGYVHDMPIGLSFIGRAWTDAAVLQLGAAYERAAHVRRAPRYLPSIEGTPAIETLLAPPVK